MSFNPRIKKKGPLSLAGVRGAMQETVMLTEDGIHHPCIFSVLIQELYTTPE
jgi:hypothetical protein